MSTGSLDDRLDDRARQILELLSHPTRRPSQWPLRSPEFRKNLDRLYMAIRDTQRLRRAGRLRPDQEQALERLLLEPQDLTTLNSDSLGLLLEGVDQLLVEAGDARLICSLLEVEYARDAYEAGGAVPTWSAIHKEARPAATASFATGGTVSDAELSEARNRLTMLLRARHSLYTLNRARGGTKAVRLLGLAPVLAALVAALVVVLDVVSDDADWRDALLVAVAGALGATLATVIKLRDSLPRLGDLRTFWYAFPLQLPLGAAAGLVLWIVLESGAIDIGGDDGWATRALVAFTGGFSEPFLLRTIERIAGGGREDGAAPSAS